MAATLINAGNPTIFIRAADLGLTGTEMPAVVNADADLLARAETIRAAGAVVMGLAETCAEATANRPHTPKLMLLAEPAGYLASDGRPVAAADIQLTARIFSMGQLHHAMTGTGAVALAAAAAIPGTLPHALMQPHQDGELVFGHPSGTLSITAGVSQTDGSWRVDQVSMSRTARILMEGWVRIPRG
ncbi:PrpF domain-containing protein [Zoogloea sp. LCSB751]|uniref:PrpF domain-containing protein n=1 Tax=Zoogloea sp. LCSB751 TaxID=1965277 RepID=UPI0020B12132|nr:PrpF domain-containing protein [Zoogloea sp. LCSB751]